MDSHLEAAPSAAAFSLHTSTQLNASAGTAGSKLAESQRVMPLRLGLSGWTPRYRTWKRAHALDEQIKSGTQVSSNSST